MTEANSNIDVLFIAGDLFDHQLYLNTPEVLKVIKFFNRLLDYCHEHDITISVLEGTPLHDQHQSKLLVKLNDIRKSPIDLRYHQVLEIEYLEKIKKHILYIPDQWITSQEELEKQVNAKLAEHNISKVDIAILHGAFKYQTNGIHTSEFSYDESYFLNLVRGFIHIGHYHTHNPMDRILPNGSLERLAHGEEEDKGYVTVTDNEWHFHVNPFSYIYKTIPVTKKTTLDSLDKQIFKYPNGSHIRLMLKKDHPFNSIFTEIKARYLDYNIKKLVKDDSSDSSTVAYILTDETELTLSDNLILETNVKETLLSTIKAKYTLSKSETLKLDSYLEIFDSSTSTETLLS